MKETTATKTLEILRTTGASCYGQWSTICIKRFLHLHHHIRTRLDLICPDYPSSVLEKQAKQKVQHYRQAQKQEFFVGQLVMARNIHSGPDWVPAVVIERLGPLTYLVETADYLLWKRHINLLRELRWAVKQRLHSLQNQSLQIWIFL